MRSYIENCVQTMKNEYKNNPKRIRSDYNREREAIEVYKGRELLELIQNADDELLDDMSREIRLSFINGILRISNNGSPFSEDGIDSLMYSNISAKAQKKDVIGNKGTGFRAILGWAKEIRVNSGDLSIRFSDSYAQNVLFEILKGTDQIKSSKKYRAATLVFPEWVDDINERNYTTDIFIHIDNDQAIIEDICKQLNDIDCELLLFLNRTEELIVETESRIVKYRKHIQDGDKILIEEYVDGELIDQQEWRLNRKNGEFEGKHFSIVVAYNPNGLKQKRQVIYSYFPTDVEFPFPVLLHANFNLNSDRNHLIKNNNANHFILEQASKLLIDTAIKLTEDEVSYASLMILAPQKPISKELADYGFNEILNDEIKHNRLFPTVNSRYISFDECPKFYTSYLSQYLDGEGFDDLLIYTKNEVICNLIKKLNHMSYPVYSYDDIIKKIDKWAKSNTPDNRIIKMHAYCAIGFLQHYENSIEAKNHKKMPLLIYDTDGKLVTHENSVFLKDRNSDISNPPSFAQIKFMHPDMRSSFEEILKVSGRNLASMLSLFGVKEYNTARIIEKMNSVIKKLLDADKVAMAKQFCESEMKWIWENRQILESAGEKIKIYLITRSGEVRISDELYMGKEYGNQICENLFEGLFEDKFVDDIKKHINTGESSMQEITAFLQTLGLDKFPKKKTKKIHPNKSYKSRLLEGLHFPFTLPGDMFKDLNDITNRVISVTADVTIIEELEVILENCDSQHIIEWIKADSMLSQILYTRKEISNSRVDIKWDMKHIYRYLPLDKIYAYIYWKFETIPWIKVGDKRFKMSECILSKIGTILEPILVEPDIEYYIKDIEGSKSRIKTDYEYIFGKLGVENDFADLTSEKIYTVLNLLPEINSSESIAKRFYAALAKSDRAISDIELRCQEFDKYMELGQVLCNTGYQKIKEAWYLDGKSICDKIANTYNLIEIPKRQNSSRIRRLLGVEKLVLKGEVVGNPEVHPENLLFQRDFILYKPMAFCYRLDSSTKDEARRFSELDIILCTNLTARYTEKEIELDDYDFILRDSKTFYLKIPKTLKSLDEMKRNVSFSAAIANVLCSFIDVSESFASFRELYGTNDYSRKELINQIFEDDSILERAKIELNYSEDTKEEYIRILSKCSGKKPHEVADLAADIDFDNLTAISNAKLIINCFKKLGVEIDEYNAEQPSTSIDLYNYYQSELSKLLPKYENLYKIHHFYRLKGKGIEEKKKLVELFLNYEYINPQIRNSVNFDCEAELISQLGIKKDAEDVDLVSLYNKNYSEWKARLKNTEYLNEFLSIPVNMSCVYYAEYYELNKAYSELLSLRLADGEETEDGNEEVIKPEVLRPTTTPAPKDVSTNGKNGNKRTGFTPPKDLEKIGFMGEKYVFDMLKEQYSSIKWVSENAKVIGINPEGRAGLGYDIEYLDEKGNRRFVEVKSSKTTEIVFYLSDSEFDFAIKHVSDYAIFFVSEVRSKNPKILLLDNVFLGNDFNIKNYSLDTKKEYKVSANIV
jgi:hypothetical protein